MSKFTAEKRAQIQNRKMGNEKRVKLALINYRDHENDCKSVNLVIDMIEEMQFALNACVIVIAEKFAYFEQFPNVGIRIKADMIKNINVNGLRIYRLNSQLTEVERDLINFYKMERKPTLFDGGLIQ